MAECKELVERIEALVRENVALQAGIEEAGKARDTAIAQRESASYACSSSEGRLRLLREELAAVYRSLEAATPEYGWAPSRKSGYPGAWTECGSLEEAVEQAVGAGCAEGYWTVDKGEGRGTYVKVDGMWSSGTCGSIQAAFDRWDATRSGPAPMPDDE